MHPLDGYPGGTVGLASRSREGQLVPAVDEVGAKTTVALIAQFISGTSVHRHISDVERPRLGERWPGVVGAHTTDSLDTGARPRPRRTTSTADSEAGMGSVRTVVPRR